MSPTFRWICGDLEDYFMVNFSVAMGQRAHSEMLWEVPRSQTTKRQNLGFLHFVYHFCPSFCPLSRQVCLCQKKCKKWTPHLALLCCSFFNIPYGLVLVFASSQPQVVSFSFIFYVVCEPLERSQNNSLINPCCWRPISDFHLQTSKITALHPNKFIS